MKLGTEPGRTSATDTIYLDVERFRSGPTGYVTGYPKTVAGSADHADTQDAWHLTTASLPISSTFIKAGTDL